MYIMPRLSESFIGMIMVFSCFFYLKVQSNPWNPEKAPLQQVISNHFVTTTISKSCTVKEFQVKHDLRVNSANFFVECTNTIVKDFRDVMLMDKVMFGFGFGQTNLMRGCTFDTNYYRKVASYSQVRLLDLMQVNILISTKCL